MRNILTVAISILMLYMPIFSGTNEEQSSKHLKNTKIESSKSKKKKHLHNRNKTNIVKSSTKTFSSANNVKTKFQTKLKNYWEVDISTTQKTLIKNKIDSLPKIRGIHLTSWVGGNAELRHKIIKNIKSSIINAVVVDIKEKNGKVYIPGIEKAYRWGSYEAAIKKPESMVEDFKKAGIYTMARIVCFHDDTIPMKNPSIAVKNPDGSIWRGRKGSTWVDPYKKETWNYILDVAERAAELGFNEIQFDYVRYPTEGNTSMCRFSQIHNRENATKNIASFLDYARDRLSKYNVKISADVFGLTTGSDMGIGQDLNLIASHADYVYPMMYPSHYYNREYNLKNPESQPYKLIDRAMKHALKNAMGNYHKIRPYLQDFSLKWKYGAPELRAQIIAARVNMVDSWILWNPSAKYSWEALTPQMYRAFIDPNYMETEKQN